MRECRWIRAFVRGGMVIGIYRDKIRLMKKIILICAITSMFAACKDHPDTRQTETIGTTTTPAGESVAARPVVVQKEVRYVNTSSHPAVARRRGMSKAAKGALIGAGSGALLGAVVSKKHGKGAIIGGVSGAGVGYLLGRHKDKKDGRY